MKCVARADGSSTRGSFMLSRVSRSAMPAMITASTPSLAGGDIYERLCMKRRFHIDFEVAPTEIAHFWWYWPSRRGRRSPCRRREKGRWRRDGGDKAKAFHGNKMFKPPRSLLRRFALPERKYRHYCMIDFRVPSWRYISSGIWSNRRLFREAFSLLLIFIAIIEHDFMMAFSSLDKEGRNTSIRIWRRSVKICKWRCPVPSTQIGRLSYQMSDRDKFAWARARRRASYYANA